MSGTSTGSTMRPRLRSCAINLALMLGAIGLVVACLEIGLRLFGSPRGDWYAAGPQRLEFLRRHVERNDHGFRDREFDPVKPPGTERILAVGDSFTFGDGIARVEDTWPRVLETLLREHGRYQVYNLGVPGTNTAFQRALLVRRRAWDLQPDRLVLGFVLNDPEPPNANREIVPRRLYLPLLPPQGLDARLTRSSYAYAWLRKAKNRLYERWRLKDTYADYVAELYDPASPSWSAFVDGARGLVADAQQRGVPVTVAIFPMFSSLEAYPFEEQHRQAARVFADAGADVVDLLDVFREVPTTDVHVSPGDAHPNETAHRMAAEHIARALINE